MSAGTRLPGSVSSAISLLASTILGKASGTVWYRVVPRKEVGRFESNRRNPQARSSFPRALQDLLERYPQHTSVASVLRPSRRSQIL